MFPSFSPKYSIVQYLHERPEESVEPRLERVRLLGIRLEGRVQLRPEELHAEHREHEQHEQHERHYRPQVARRFDDHAYYGHHLEFVLWGAVNQSTKKV